MSSKVQFVRRLANIIPNAIFEYDKLNFRCSFCGDGIKDKKKRSGWLLPDMDYMFKCFNCSLSMSFENFLKEYNIGLYTEYMQTLFHSTFENGISNEPVKKYKQIFNFNMEFMELNDKYIRLNHFPHAEEYLRNRKVPEKFFNQLYYVKDISELPIWKDGGKKYKSEMIIFPFYQGDKIYGWSGRAIKEKKFMIHLPVDTNIKIYNLFNVDVEQKVYIFESIIDSMYVDNSIALNGAKVSDAILNKIPNRVFCLDNDKTGWSNADYYLSKGEKVCLFPVKNSKVKDKINYCKDMNDIVKKGVYSEDKINLFIHQNTYEEFDGRMAIRQREILNV